MQWRSTGGVALVQREMGCGGLIGTWSRLQRGTSFRDPLDLANLT
jgi:hypothetical protein